MLTVGSLFAGVGGIDLGLERAGMRVIWQSEVDAEANRVLARQWPSVPNHGDATLIDYSRVERPDVLAGGFMCTDLSHAGKQEGLNGDTRSGVTWREFVRAAGVLRPRYLFVENVPALLSGDGGRWFGTVLGTLASLGYDAEWDCIPAAAVGAPHLRDRVYIVAYPARMLCLGGAHNPGSGGGGVFPVPEPGNRHRVARSWRREWVPEPGLSPVAHGIPAPVALNCGYGNAVVPQVAELIGRWIVAHAADAR